MKHQAGSIEAIFCNKTQGGAMEMTYGFRNLQEQLWEAINLIIQHYRPMPPEDSDQRAEHLQRARQSTWPTIARVSPVVKGILAEYLYSISSRECLIIGEYVYLEQPSAWVYIWKTAQAFAPAVQIWLDEDCHLVVVYPVGGYPAIDLLCSLIEQHTRLSIIYRAPVSELVVE